MLAQRCTGWHLTSLGKSHLNSLTDMSNAFSCTKRETMEEANEQMFKGDLWMAQRLRNGVFFCRDTTENSTFMVKHGSLMETSEAPRILSWAYDKTFERWKLSHQTPAVHNVVSTLHSGEGIESGWIVEWLCGRSVHHR